MPSLQYAPSEATPTEDQYVDPGMQNSPLPDAYAPAPEQEAAPAETQAAPAEPTDWTPVAAAPTQAAPTAQPTEAAPKEDWTPVATAPTQQGAAQQGAGQPVQAPADGGPPPDVREGNLRVASADTKDQLGQAVGKLASGDFGGAKDQLLGALGGQIAAQGGDILPSRRINTDFTIERAMNELNTGDSFAGRTNVNPLERVADEVVAGPNEPVVQWINENPDAANEAFSKGYTTPEGVVWEAGPTAVWERFVSEKTGAQRALLDVAADPVGSIAGLVATPVREATALPKAVRLGAAAVDIGASLGTSELVPTGLKGIGAVGKKIGILAPSSNQLLLDEAGRVVTGGEEAAVARREAGQVGSTSPNLETKSGVTTLTDPDGVAPPISYKVERAADGSPAVAGIVDDPSNPGVVRPVTDADRDVVLQHLNTASYEDYGAITEPWYNDMFERQVPGQANRTSYLETLDPEVGVPLGRTQEWTRYRDMMAGRMQAIDSANPDAPVLRTLLGKWENDLLVHQELAGSTVAERRLSAIEKIADQSGLRTPGSLQDQWLTEARAKLAQRTVTPFQGRLWDDTLGAAVPLPDAGQKALMAQANKTPQDFYKQIGSLKNTGMRKLVDFHAPLPSPATGLIDPAQFERSQNMAELFDKRLQVFGERELVAAKPWLQKLQTAGITSGGGSIADREAEALLNVVNASPIFSGRTISSVDDLITEIEGMASRTRMEFPQLPAGVQPTLTSSLSPRASAPAPGTYRAGSWEEAIGTAGLSKPTAEAIEATYSFGGESAPIWRKIVGLQDEGEKARALAQLAETRPLTAAEQSTLDRFVNEMHTYAEFKNPRTGYELTGKDIAGWDDATVDRLAALRTQRFVKQAQGVVDSTGRAVDPAYYRGAAGKLLRAYDDFAGFRRSMSLYSTTRGPAYVLVQALGNGFTLALTKPSAVGRDGLYNPSTANTIRRYLKDPSLAPPPEAIKFRDQLGLGRSESLGKAGRDQTGSLTAFAKSRNPVVRGIGKIAAPQVIKETADSIDIAMRHGIYLTEMEPALMALKRELPDMAEDAVRRGATGVPVSLGRPEIEAALDNLGARFSPTEFRNELITQAGGRTAPNQTELWKAADRAAGDYANELKKLDTAAFDEVDRLAFDFRETRADAVLGRVFMFHYWMSRASVLYLTDAARNPLHAQLWSRAMSAGAKKAEEQGWPEWQKDWMGFLSTPAGYTAFAQPSYLLGTAFFFADTDQPNPAAKLSALGSFLEGTPVLKDMMLSPALSAAIYVTGAGGPDFRPPDFLGTGKWTSDINTWLDKANVDVHTFWSENGKPKDVPNLDGRTLVTWATQLVNNKGWDVSFLGLSPAKPYDPNRSTQVDMSYYIMDDILQQNPQLNLDTKENADEVASMVEEALAHPESDLYQSALRKHVDQQMVSSGTGMAPIDFITGAAKHILPFGITTQVDSRQDAMIRKNLNEKTALDSAMGEMVYDTPEGQKFWGDFSGVFDSGTPKQKGVTDYYSAIKGGTIDQTQMQTLVLEGKSWTGEQLRALPQEDRETLAKYWMDVNGYWPEQNEFYKQRDDAMAANPDVANALTLKDYANQYPGGVSGFIQDTMRLNPNYARYVDGLQSSLDAGQIDQAEFQDKATNSVAYTHIAGIKTSSFDYDPITSGRGRVAGLAEGESLASWAQENDSAAVEGTSSFEEKKGQLDTELGGYLSIQQRLNQIDQYYGNPIGTSARAYSESLARGDKYVQPQWIYDQLKAEGFTTKEINPGEGNQVGWYLKWVLNQMPGSDLSTDTYWNQNSTNYRKKEVERINSGIVSVDTAPGSTDLTNSLATLGGSIPKTATTTHPTQLRKEPGGPATTDLSAGVLMTPGQMAKGSDGSMWIFVTPQGFTSSGGWVPVQDLAGVS